MLPPCLFAHSCFKACCGRRRDPPPRQGLRRRETARRKPLSTTVLPEDFSDAWNRSCLLPPLPPPSPYRHLDVVADEHRPNKVGRNVRNLQPVQTPSPSPLVGQDGPGPRFPGCTGRAGRASSRCRSRAGPGPAQPGQRRRGLRCSPRSAGTGGPGWERSGTNRRGPAGGVPVTAPRRGGLGPGWRSPDRNGRAASLGTPATRTVVARGERGEAPSLRRPLPLPPRGTRSRSPRTLQSTWAALRRSWWRGPRRREDRTPGAVKGISYLRRALPRAGRGTGR